jgi:hypothetical protein
VEDHERQEPQVDGDGTQWGRAHSDLVVDMLGFIEQRIWPEMRARWFDRTGRLRPDWRWIDARSAEFLRYCADLIEPLEPEPDPALEPQRARLVLLPDQGSSR